MHSCAICIQSVFSYERTAVMLAAGPVPNLPKIMINWHHDLNLALIPLPLSKMTLEMQNSTVSLQTICKLQNER